MPATPWFALYPFGGGGAGSFGPLNAYLAGHHRHVPIYPGRDHRYREPSHTTFADLTGEAWQQLNTHLDTHPPANLILFGYSLGAMVAADMARRLQTNNTPPKALVVAGAAAPTTWRTHGLTGLDDDTYIDRLKTLGIAPREILEDPALRHHLMPIWRADAAVAESVPRTAIPFDCPVHALGGTHDPLVDPDDLNAWADLGAPGSTTQILTGDHGTLIHHPVALARTLLRATLPTAVTHTGAA